MNKLHLTTFPFSYIQDWELKQYIGVYWLKHFQNLLTIDQQFKKADTRFVTPEAIEKALKAVNSQKNMKKYYSYNRMGNDVPNNPHEYRLDSDDMRLNSKDYEKLKREAEQEMKAISRVAAELNKNPIFRSKFFKPLLVNEYANNSVNRSVFIITNTYPDDFINDKIKHLENIKNLDKLSALFFVLKVLMYGDKDLNKIQKHEYTDIFAVIGEALKESKTFDDVLEFIVKAHLNYSKHVNGSEVKEVFIEKARNNLFDRLEDFYDAEGNKILMRDFYEFIDTFMAYLNIKEAITKQSMGTINLNINNKEIIYNSEQIINNLNNSWYTNFIKFLFEKVNELIGSFDNKIRVLLLDMYKAYYDDINDIMEEYARVVELVYKYNKERDQNVKKAFYDSIEDHVNELSQLVTGYNYDVSHGNTKSPIAVEITFNDENRPTFNDIIVDHGLTLSINNINLGSSELFKLYNKLDSVYNKNRVQWGVNKNLDEIFNIKLDTQIDLTHIKTTLTHLLTNLQKVFNENPEELRPLLEYASTFDFSNLSMDLTKMGSDTKYNRALQSLLSLPEIKENLDVLKEELGNQIDSTLFKHLQKLLIVNINDDILNDVILKIADEINNDVTMKTKFNIDDKGHVVRRDYLDSLIRSAFHFGVVYPFLKDVKPNMSETIKYKENLKLSNTVVRQYINHPDLSKSFYMSLSNIKMIYSTLKYIQESISYLPIKDIHTLNPKELVYILAKEDVKSEKFVDAEKNLLKRLNDLYTEYISHNIGSKSSLKIDLSKSMNLAKEIENYGKTKLYKRLYTDLYDTGLKNIYRKRDELYDLVYRLITENSSDSNEYRHIKFQTMNLRYQHDLKSMMKFAVDILGIKPFNFVLVDMNQSAVYIPPELMFDKSILITIVKNRDFKEYGKEIKRWMKDTRVTTSKTNKRQNKQGN